MSAPELRKKLNCEIWPCMSFKCFWCWSCNMRVQACTEYSLFSLFFCMHIYVCIHNLFAVLLFFSVCFSFLLCGVCVHFKRSTYSNPSMFLVLILQYGGHKHAQNTLSLSRPSLYFLIHQCLWCWIWGAQACTEYSFYAYRGKHERKCW